MTGVQTCALPISAAATEQLLPDYLRVLGARHPTTLITRRSLAYWRGESGDAAGAAAALDELLTDSLRVLGPHHPHTLYTRKDLARWRAAAEGSTSAKSVLDKQPRRGRLQ